MERNNKRKRSLENNDIKEANEDIMDVEIKHIGKQEPKKEKIEDYIVYLGGEKNWFTQKYHKNLDKEANEILAMATRRAGVLYSQMQRNEIIKY